MAGSTGSARTATRSDATIAARCRAVDDRRHDAVADELARRRDLARRAASPTSSPSCPRSSRSIRSICRRGWARPPLPTPLDRVFALSADAGVTFVDPARPLRDAKTRERVYFQTDSHWNYNGADVGYEALMRAVQRALPGRLAAIAPAQRPAVRPGVDFYSGDLRRCSGLPARHARGRRRAARQGPGAAGEPLRAARTDKDEFRGFEFFACDRPGLPRAVVLRDSMAIAAHSAAVGELQPRRVRRARASSIGR